jgi:hypothetical protein
MPTSIQANVRAPLATALASVAASVYESVPEALIAPAAIIIPGIPYMETTLISSSVQVKINFTITAAVAFNNNAGALDNLEKLALQILAAIPSGYVVGDVSRPSITALGSSNFLTSDIDVSTYYKQEN